MKTNVLFSLLLAVSIAFVIGCPGTPEDPPNPTPATQPKPEPKSVSWQSQVAGEYPGIISNAGEEFTSKTTFKVEADRISGTYEMDVNGMQYTGELSKFTIVGECKFKCRWRNNEDRQGNFSGMFSADLSSFQGKWDPDDEDGDGDWNGKKKQKEPTTPGAAAPAASWQSKVAGEYPGIISNAGEEYPSKTVFKVEADKLSGTYELDVNGMQYAGKLSKFSIVSDRKFKCRWRDDQDREGNLSGTFAADLSGFEGKWDSDDEEGDGDWKGKKNQ